MELYLKEIVLDETGIYYEISPPYTVARKGTNNVATKGTHREYKRWTVVATVEADGTKVPSSFALKEQPGIKIKILLNWLNINRASKHIFGSMRMFLKNGSMKLSNHRNKRNRTMSFGWSLPNSLT
jgi:hypothetical protein